ncbi:MAG: sugar ABC transporter permease [Clostridia bacterium]|nr:sugar ABC transporter permease [Clostridia bacterium]
MQTEIKKAGSGVLRGAGKLVDALRTGDFRTRLSFLIMGFGLFTRRQFARGFLLLLCQIAFLLYFAFAGLSNLSRLTTLGSVASKEVYDEALGIFVYKYFDNSLLILLYSVLTILFALVFVYLWYKGVLAARAAQAVEESGKRLKSAKEDLRALLDEEYHKTLLALPVLGLTVFTVLPILFMVLIAFTNFDVAHKPPKELFTWVGWENFKALLSGTAIAGGSKFAHTFKEVLLWNIVWAVSATLSNYFLGMLLAIAINKKGIRFKKFWRSVFVTTIAVPQFVSLMLLSKMLADTGVVNRLLLGAGLLSKAIPFLSDGNLARVTVILVNLWVGVPYTVLICTGILMNIPADLYEAARIDGAGPIVAYFKITLPYMLHITTPYLISQFIANFNNFNVIFLLTGGDPLVLDYAFAGRTDLLITWLYKLTFNESNYKIAAVISIFVFLVVGTVSLIVYNLTNAVKNEEEFG